MGWATRQTKGHGRLTSDTRAGNPLTVDTGKLSMVIRRFPECRML